MRKGFLKFRQFISRFALNKINRFVSHSLSVGQLLIVVSQGKFNYLLRKVENDLPKMK